MTTGFLGAADHFGYVDLLSEAEKTVLTRLRCFLQDEAEPVLADHWERGETPLFLRDRLAGLDLVDPAEVRGAGESVRPLFLGFRNLEFSRVDGSLAILFGGQAGMFRTVVATGGSEQQLASWDEDIASFRMTGCFALTEPDHGSDIARGVQTEARRDGDGWVLNGAKRWIGNAAFSEYVAVAAKDADDGQVKVFLARADDPGLDITKIEGKTSLRMVHNADIGLRDVRVPETHRLQRINSFADLNRAFETLRPDVVWNATGLQLGLYETVLEYTRKREQFGRPIGGILAGHFGDRIGRKRMLVLSLYLMGGATVLIGLIPTYESIGLWAPALLTVLRLVQGLGVGAEWGGAVTMAVEHAPADKRSL
ncbi:MFS transporter [Citricoccus nitrophenolicus]|uniref:MFS transporter n=1 Tax=Citricoccus nitrophenolicus TaxID=863575 RepID=UPI0031ECC1BD